MRLKDVMTKNVEVIESSATIREAAQKMKTLDVGPLPVLEGHQLVGMITDRDITVRAIAEGRDPNTTKVKEVITTEMIYGFEDQDVQEAAKLMGEKQIRRLVVLDHEQRLVGIVSLGDLSVDTRDKKMAGEVLKKVSQPSQPKR
jgi:CBS domain-containing protein